MFIMCILLNQRAQVKAKITWILISSLDAHFLWSLYQTAEGAGKKPES